MQILRTELEQRYDEPYCQTAVEQNGYMLQYVHNQTEAICLIAVKNDGDTLQYVHDQTEAICQKAVKQNDYAIRFVSKPFWHLFENMISE